jgi:hypothetical protein
MLENSLAKIQQQLFFPITIVPHQQFAYDTALGNLHWRRPYVIYAYNNY